MTGLARLALVGLVRAPLRTGVRLVSLAAHQTLSSRQHLDQGGLSCTVGAEEAVDAALWNGQIHPVDCLERAIRLSQIASKDGVLPATGLPP